MPINVQNKLPAKKALESENIFVMTTDRASAQEIRPLKILILNIMPKKLETETQILRLLSNTPLQVDVHFLQVKSHKSKNTSATHIKTFYKTIDDICNESFDGMIVTGAPLEKIEYSEVDYYDELCDIFNWSESNVYSSMFICWGAMIALNRFYDIPKYTFDKKLSGIFSHRITDNLHPLLRGFDDEFFMPQSRHTGIDSGDLRENSNLTVLVTSEEAGDSIIVDKKNRKFFILGHPEYDRNTLAEEYFRDTEKNLNPVIPQNYFPADDVSAEPVMKWRSCSSLLFSNWLNYFVYQETPYNLDDIKKLTRV